MTADNEKETPDSGKEPAESAAETISLKPDLVHYGMDISFVPSWGPRTNSSFISALFEASIFDAEEEKRFHTRVSLDDLIIVSGRFIFVIKAAFDTINRMSGFKILTRFRNKDVLIQRIDRLIEYMNAVKKVISENDVVIPYDEAEKKESKK